MGKVIERLCRCNAERANYLLLSIKTWAAYLGIVCLGGMIFSAPLYVWFDRSLAAADVAHQAEIGRMQAVNQELMVVIKDRLPPIVKQADDAIQAAKGAATKAGTAATKATAAAKSASTAVRKVEEALAPHVPAPPASVPEWLNTP
ncbi:hypothetical protein [Achromobacter spanius]|uniref:hypothetical protein n=1 Tax=Achromobacter spanius TaxID=217203 RepID=UPI003A920DBF